MLVLLIVLLIIILIFCDWCCWLVADSIEANIENASVNVVRGSEHIRQARSHLVALHIVFYCLLATANCYYFTALLNYNSVIVNFAMLPKGFNFVSSSYLYKHIKQCHQSVAVNSAQTMWKISTLLKLKLSLESSFPHKTSNCNFWKRLLRLFFLLIMLVEWHRMTWRKINRGYKCIIYYQFGSEQICVCLLAGSILHKITNPISNGYYTLLQPIAVVL